MNNFGQNKIYHIKVDALETNKNSKTPPLPPNNVLSSLSQIQQSTNENSNSLSGLLSHYNSDSESEAEENTDKLDLKVDNFLQEINEINNKPTENVKTAPELTTSWQECYDTSSGFPYYWNTVTNEVTWEIPKEYADFLEHEKNFQKAKNVEPLFKIDGSLEIPKNNPSKNEVSKSSDITTTEEQTNVQIPPVISSKSTTEEIKQVETEIKTQNSEEIEKAKNLEVKNVNKKKRQGTRPPKVRKKSTDSDEGKIELITSFCEDSTDSEPEPKLKAKLKNDIEVKEKIEEKEKSKSPPPVHGPHVEDIPAEYFPPKEEKREIIETLKENVDETVILARLRTQAKVLQELDGELPKSVETFLTNIEKENVKNPPSLSLVAGYGQESEDEGENSENEKPKTLFPIPENCDGNKNTFTSESTLFPKQEKIDLNQFQIPEEEKNAEKVADLPNEDSIGDSKLLKRKKRIAFDVLPTIAEKKLKNNHGDLPEKLGFGFKSFESTPGCEVDSNKSYINFQKGEVAFVKSEDKSEKPENSENIEKLQEMKEILSEKVEFLCIAKDQISPVQLILIQLNTLDLAFKAGGLSANYLSNWLKQTNSELANLEKEATPKGWICQWDRSHKRYFYKNEKNGKTQWDYPDQDPGIEESQPSAPQSNVPDIVGGGEEMDICTTPPPGEEKVVEVPSPPPPPIITVTTGVDHTKENFQPPLPPQIMEIPPPPPPPSISDQPPPPGVESTNQNTTNKSFTSELDSFYSDIAKLDTSQDATKISSEVNNVKLAAINNEVGKTEVINEGGTTEAVKKKKKPKSKIGQGLTMKKKNVSNLVAKWKKVQNEFP